MTIFFNKITEKDFDDAVAELTSLINQQAELCQSMGYGFFPSDNAPESFKELKSFGRFFPVANYGSEKAIYDKETNIKFRFWHDCLHLMLDQSFSTKAESIVADCHLYIARQNKLSNLALSILEADTKGQVLYYDRHKSFVSNQKAFVQTVISCGLNTALLVRM